MNKTDDFVRKAKLVHGNKYDYSKVEYVNSHEKVCIICPEHGEFWQEPYNHLNGHKCYYCGTGKKTTEQFIKEAKQIHGEKYDYSKTEYYSANKKLTVTCKKHGDFSIRASSHLAGCGCKKCAIEQTANNQRKKLDEFIAEAKNIHGEKYDYSKVEYTNVNKKVCIICPEHGEFWQTPNAHITLRQGCPFCKNSRMHDFLSLKLTENEILYEREKTFDWLKYVENMRIDFFLPEYNIAIECQGGQHFKSVKKFGGNNGLELRIKRDLEKKKLCEEHNIKVLYIIPKAYKSHLGNFIYNTENSLILEDKNMPEKLINIINKNIL